jgi:hypothetical protein
MLLFGMSSFRTESRSRRRLMRAVIEAVEARTLLTSYYISPTGSDAATGTSASTAWKSFSKVNSLDLNAGDQVLLQGGQTFNPAAPSTTNQLSNSNFESTTLTSWTRNYDETAGNSSLTTTASDVHGGLRALRVGGAGAGGRGQSVTSKLKAGSSYLLSLWAKVTSGTGKATGGITFYNKGQQVARAPFSITSSSYTKYSAAVVAPSTFDSVDVWVTKADGTSVLYVDDVTLNETYGTLVFNSSDSGTASNPVTISSYGTGRAILNSGDGFGLSALDVSGFQVKNLVFDGTWDGLTATGTNAASGITINNNQSGDTKLNFIRIDNVDVSGFKWAGIDIQGDNGKSGFNDVRITNSVAHDNGDVGIRFEGEFNAASTDYSNTNVYVGYSQAYNNGGLPGIGRNSGTGIIFGDVDGGTIERSAAWNNGQNCNYTGGGPIGIWAWDSNKVTLQYNESYGNQTGNVSLDGGGFDFDGGVTNSVMQYNYAHDNDGAGFLLYQFTGARAFGTNVVRYNISENDGRQGHYGGIYMGGGSAVSNNWIYNNTIYLSPGADSTIAGIKLVGIGTNNRFRNNIVYTTGGVRLLDSNSAYATTSAQFQGNDWYAGGSTFAIRWGGTTYSDLATWRNTGQEKNGTASTGLSVNPQLGSAGNGGTIGDATQLNTLSAYKLASTSPVINKGVNLSSFGIDPGPYDYYGSPSITGGTSDIGAHEYAPPITPPPPPPPVTPPSSISGTDSADTFMLRIGTSGKVECFVNTSTSSTPTYSWSPGTLDTYSIAGLNGDDTLTIDLTKGNPLPSGGLTFNAGGGAGDRLIIIQGSSSNGVAVAAGSLIPGGGSGPALLHSGVESIQIGGSAAVVSAAYASLQAATSATSGGLSIAIASGSSAVFSTPQDLDTLSVGGKVSVAPGGGNTLSVSQLDIAAGATLDLGDNDMIVDYAGSSPLGVYDGTQYTGLTGLIASARGDKSWSGPGLTSSAAKANPRTTLAIGEASDLLDLSPGENAVYDGQTVDSTTVLVKYTYSGDTTLDGKLSVDDFTRLDFHAPLGVSGYANGDVNLDGRINVDDFIVLDYGTPIQGDPL